MHELDRVRSSVPQGTETPQNPQISPHYRVRDDCASEMHEESICVSSGKTHSHMQSCEESVNAVGGNDSKMWETGTLLQRRDIRNE